MENYKVMDKYDNTCIFEALHQEKIRVWLSISSSMTYSVFAVYSEMFLLNSPWARPLVKNHW